MQENYKILVVDDDMRLRALLERYLTEQGFQVRSVANAEQMDRLLTRESFHLMVLDLMLPGEDGLSICRRLRSQSNPMPIIMVTAKGEEVDRIVGLEIGADDYIPKPFNPRELLARIRSLTRRGRDFTPSTLSAGSTSLDTEEQELSAHNSIRLSGKETKLMKLFMLHEGKNLSTSYIFQKIWSGEKGVDESVVRIYISYLREKLSAINSDLAITGEEGKDFTLTVREG